MGILESSNLPQLVGDLKQEDLFFVPWGHHRLIIDRCKEDTEFGMDEVNLYNLTIIGEKVRVISSCGDKFSCYYPKKLSLTLRNHEAVVLMTEDKIISEEWVEEGLDDENDCATDSYKLYYKVIIRDFDRNNISEEIGSIHQAPDGTYWIS